MVEFSMNRPRSNSRFSLPVSLCLALCLTLGNSAPAAAAQVPLRAFSASYDLHKSGMHFGIAELSLAPFENHWRWRLTTEARGIYASLYNKKPYTETVFSFAKGVLQLRSIVLSDANDEQTKDYESASFDWTNGKVDALRKGRQIRLALSAEVYDYQSIHLLAASMQMQQLQQATVSFYRKGKLIDSKLVYQGEASVEIQGKQVAARVFEQTIDGSKTKTTYYYDADNPLLPLLVETRKGDASPTILRLRKVEWFS
jgi:hypothetical protein